MNDSTILSSPNSSSASSASSEDSPPSFLPPNLLFPNIQPNPTIALSTQSIPFKLPDSTHSHKTPIAPKRSLSLSAQTYNSQQPFFTTVRTSVHQPNSPGIEETTFTGLQSSMESNNPIKQRTRRNLNSYTTTTQQSLQPSNNTNQLEAKVVILGSQGVGKTSIVHRYTSGHFSYSLSSTIGASFLTKKLVVDDCRVRLQIWDTAGQERFRSMAPLYYRGALAAILIYDITNLDSFNDVKAWLEELRRNMSPDLIIHVVGSKADLASTQRAVDLEIARLAVAEWVLEAEAESPSGFLSKRSLSPPAAAVGGTRPRSRTLSTQRLPTMHSLSNNGITTSPGATSKVKAKASTNTLPFGEASFTSTASDFGQQSGEISRSGSKLSLSLGGLVSGRSRRGTEEGRRLFEETEKERERFRNIEKIKACGVPVTEVSAKDDDGIEELFFEITRRLVERKSQIETDRVLRSRDSIMLHDEPIVPLQTQGWCC